MRMTTNKSVGRSNTPQETATGQWLCRFAGYHVDGRTVRKQVRRVESPMECYWELRSKNAQNIKALMCPLYKNAPLRERGVGRFAEADTQSIKQQQEYKWWHCGGVMIFLQLIV